MDKYCPTLLTGRSVHFALVSIHLTADGPVNMGLSRFYDLVFLSSTARLLV